MRPCLYDEEAANPLFELLPPADHEAATRADLAALEQRMDARFARADERLESAVDRITAVIERRISEAVKTQTRTLVWSQLAALVAIAALAFGMR